MARVTELEVNGSRQRIDVEAERSLLSVLRDELDLTGAKYGCGEAQCGACIVLIDGEPWKGSMDNEPLLVQLGVGTHHVEIRKEGYRSYLTDIAVGNGQVRTLNVSLTKQ